MTRSKKGREAWLFLDKGIDQGGGGDIGGGELIDVKSQK